MSFARRVHRYVALLALAAVGCGSDASPKRTERSQPREEKVCTFPQGPTALEAVCGCTRVEGDLAIELGSSGDLACLATLREVTGLLALGSRMSSSISSLHGLGELRRVGTLQLSGLAVADLSGLANLQSADELELSALPLIVDLRGLERVRWTQLTLQNLAELRSLEGLRVPETIAALTLSDDPKLESLEALRPMRAAESVLLTKLAALATLDGMSAEIDRLQVAQCDSLVDLRGLTAGIRSFVLENNAQLRALDGFAGLLMRPGAATGPEVRIENQPELESLEGLFAAEQQAIARLHLMGLPKIESVDLRSASQLGALVVRSCNALREIRGVESIEEMAQLHLTGLPAMSRLPAFDALRSVGDLELIELRQIGDLAPLAKLTMAKAMSLNMLDSLSSLHGFERLESVGRLLLEDLHALENLDGLRSLRSAETLWIQDTDKLENLRGLALQSVTELAVRYDDKLRSLDGLDTLAEIGTLDFSANPELVSIRAVRNLRQATRIFARANGKLPQCELDQLVTRLPSGTAHEFSDNGPAGACPP